MQRLRSRSVALLAGIALFALSGIALASDGDDTVINHGYDKDSHFWILNVTSLEYSTNDEEPEAEGEIEAATAEQEFADLVEECGLEATDDEGQPIEYEYAVTDGTLAVNGPDGDVTECGEWYFGDVTGPAGQVNHGMFMKHLNEWYEGDNRGCIVSHIARSPLGKGDQQVEASGEQDGESPSNGMSDPVEGTIAFTTIPADCDKGPDRDGEDSAEDDGDGERRGPPDHARNKADKWGGDGPGKSGSAGKGRP